MTGAGFALWLAPALKGFRSGRRAARGGATMDAKVCESGHLMLIMPERVFYAGLLGRPRERCPGALHVYVSIKGGLRLMTADGGDACGELFAVPPNQRHTITSDFRSAICVVIEPESVDAGAFDALAGRLSGPEGQLVAGRIRDRKSTRLNSSHVENSYAVFCLKKKK